MFAIELLFSPLGRLSRLNYVLLGGLFGALNYGLLFLMAVESGAGITEILKAGPTLFFQTNPLLAADEIAARARLKILTSSISPLWLSAPDHLPMMRLSL